MAPVVVELLHLLEYDHFLLRIGFVERTLGQFSRSWREDYVNTTLVLVSRTVRAIDFDTSVGDHDHEAFVRELFRNNGVGPAWAHGEGLFGGVDIASRGLNLRVYDFHSFIHSRSRT